MIKTSAQEAYYKFAEEKKDKTVKDHVRGALPAGGAILGGGIGTFGGGAVGGDLADMLLMKLTKGRAWPSGRNRWFDGGRLVGAGLGLGAGALAGGYAGKALQPVIE